MRARSGSFVFLLLVFIAAGSIAVGSGDQKHKILSTLFDGVGKPGMQRPKKAGRNKDACVSPSAENKAAAAPAERPRPEIEKLKTWEEILKVLPTDVSGGPDWVKAAKEGVIAPRFRLPSDPPLTAPFTFDTLVPGTVSEGTAALDANIEIVPEKAPFYKVVFPHSSHTLWLNCSSCHPGTLGQRGLGMAKIFAGESCGKCHGKVSFSTLTACSRCHANLAPATSETVEADLAKAAQSGMAASPELLERGKNLYLQDCAICHGDKGDGNGPSAGGLDPRPRDFTAGKFKFRSTSSSSLPTDFDIFRTITWGVPGTSMPTFSFLSFQDRFALCHFIKTFSDLFIKRKPEAPIPIPEPPPKTPELMETGKKFYKEAECNKCHGDSGRGDGPSAATTKDDWEQPLRPADLINGRPKSGNTLKDYYRTMMTGLKGTPMPDFNEVFEPQQAWAVVYYVFSLSEENRKAPPAVKGEILFTRKAPAAGAAPLAKASPSVPPGSTAPFGQMDENAPPSTFAHWFHRARVRCAVCHPAIFEMKAGANDITMDAIRAGKFCGKCHPSYPDPKALVAWPVSFESCARCHVER
jgi:c(7)-type cytochrome triheme protein